MEFAALADFLYFLVGAVAAVAFCIGFACGVWK